MTLGRAKLRVPAAIKQQGPNTLAMALLLVLWKRVNPAAEYQLNKNGVSPLEEFNSTFHREGIQSPMEGHSGYRGANWSPERLAFHQNLETFADRIGLIVGLQANGKIEQDQAYEEIRKLWSQLKASSKDLLSDR